MKINLIYAQSKNGIIGNDGKLPWHIPEDLARFKYLTTGCPVIMGRKTWDSLPAKFRPLPGRCNIVMSRSVQASWYVDSAEAALEMAREFYRHNYGEDVWIIGGEQIYELFLPLADYAYATLVLADYEGDARAPILPIGEWSFKFTQRLKSTTGIEYENLIAKRIW